MGLVLFPVFIGALLIFIRSVFTLVALVKGDELLQQTIFIGAAIPIAIIIGTIVYWVFKGKVYAFQPYFSFLFSLIYLPMMIRIFNKTILPLQNITNFNSILTIWIITAGVLIIPIFMNLETLLKGNGVKLFY